MKKKIWRIGFILLILLFSIIPYHVLYTEAGLNNILNLASQNIPGKLKYQSIRGSIVSGIEVNQLHYTNAEMNIEVSHGILRWQPWRLFRGILQLEHIKLDGMVVQLKNKNNDNSVNKNMKLPNIVFPVNIHLKNTELENVEIYQNGSKTFHLSYAQMALTTGRKNIDISKLLLVTAELKLDINGWIKPQDEYLLGLSVNLELNDLFSQPFNIKSHLNGSISKIAMSTEVSGFLAGRVDGDMFDVLENPRWDAEVQVNALKLQSFSSGLPKNNLSGNFTSNGTLDDFNFIGNANMFYPEVGDLKASYDGSLVGETLIIRSMGLKEKTHPTELTTSGSIDWSGDEVTYDVTTDWRQFNWPWVKPDQALDSYHSAVGRMDFKGLLSDFTLGVNAELAGKNIPGMKFSLQSQGDLNHLDVQSFLIDSMGGKIEGQLDVNWQKNFSWRGKISLQDINPYDLNQSVSGNVDAIIDTHGHFANDRYMADIKITEIAGELQNKPLVGLIEMKLSDQEIYIKQLDLHVQGSELTVRGRIAEKNNLVFSLTSEQISHIYPDVQGQLSTSGKILGPREKPYVVFKLDAKNLIFEKYAVQSLAAAADISLDLKKKMHVKLIAKKVKIESEVIDQIKLNIDGLILEHQIKLEIDQLKNKLELALSGGMNDKIWRGQVNNSKINWASLGVWQLKKSSNLQVEGQKLNLSESCFTQLQAYICFDVSHHQMLSNMNLSWRKFPLEKIQTWLPPKMKIQSFISGSVKLMVKDDQLNVIAKAKNSAGHVVLPLDASTQKISFNEGNVGFEMDAKRLKANVFLPFENSASLQANIVIDRSNASIDLVEQPLQGQVNINLPTLVFFEPFIASLKNLDRAQVDASLKLGGSIQQPIMQGEVDLTAVQLQVPDVNLTLSKVALKAEISQQQVLTFHGEATAKKGKINLKGEIKKLKNKQWIGQASIKGKDFLVVDLPVASVQISPDLLLKINERRLNVEGDVLIPFARIRPGNLPENTLTDSADLIIVGKDSVQNKESTGFSVMSNVRMILGDRVNFEGFGLRSQLKGSLQIVDKPGQVTIGQGEINLLDGYYRSFGLDLKISKGRLIFANTPIDDPSLDIKAERKIAEIIAGLNVAATLQKPQVTLFSSPVMSESDILSYLLLGRPVGQADQQEGTKLMTVATAMGLAGSELLARNIGNRLGLDEVKIQTDSDAGTSSLVIGRYLSPKLYIRYLTGIFERSNIVQLRFDVTKKIVLQTETGSQMGADVFYTIEH